MTASFDQLQELLRHHGYSLTAARKIIFEAMWHTEPQTMHEIILACEKKIDRASVYRTITLFEKLGVIERLQIGWKYKLELSDTFSHHHHHVSCVKCGITVDTAESEMLEKHINELAKSQGFSAQSHQLEIRGLCERCQNKSI